MASNPKYKYADWQELHGAQKEALEDFASRVKDTAAGTLKTYAAPFANTAGTLLGGEAKITKDSPLPPGGLQRGVFQYRLADTAGNTKQCAARCGAPTAGNI